MIKDFYFIGLTIQKPMRCRVLGEKNISGKPGRSRYLLELYEPIPTSTYLKSITSEVPKFISKLLFIPHGWEQARTEGPFWGTVAASRDETKVNLEYYDGLAGDRAILCVSEQQTQEYMQFLEESRKEQYLLDLCMATPPEPTRNCCIVKDIVVNGGKGYWLAEVDPPYPAPLLPAKSLSKIILALKDLPVQGQPIAADVCYFDQNVSMGEEVESKRIDLQAFDEGTLWRPKDREDFYRSLRK